MMVLETPCSFSAIAPAFHGCLNCCEDTYLVLPLIVHDAIWTLFFVIFYLCICILRNGTVMRKILHISLCHLDLSRILHWWMWGIDNLYTLILVRLHPQHLNPTIGEDGTEDGTKHSSSHQWFELYFYRYVTAYCEFLLNRVPFRWPKWTVGRREG